MRLSTRAPRQSVLTALKCSKQTALLPLYPPADIFIAMPVTEHTLIDVSTLRPRCAFLAIHLAFNCSWLIRSFMAQRTLDPCGLRDCMSACTAGRCIAAYMKLPVFHESGKHSVQGCGCRLDHRGRANSSAAAAPAEACADQTTGASSSSAFSGKA